MKVSSFERKIRDIFGDRCSFSLLDRTCYSFDATGESALPDCVVFPISSREISELFKVAVESGTPVIPRGAGSGFSGGSVPISGGVVVSFEKMNRIIDVDEKNLIARVEPGVVLSHFQDEVEKLGLFYPPDPSSREFCTIGGNIAECAGGPTGFKYGVTKDYVLALENVLPTGEVLKTGVRTVKGVVGYNLTQLVVGSEGTLAIVTEATLKLIPAPEYVESLLLGFTSTEEACEAVNGIIRSRVVPRAIELIDSTALDCVREYGKVDVSDDAGAYLLIDVDGFEEEVKAQVEKILQVMRAFELVSERREATPSGRERLWALRRAISPSLLRVNPKKINEDIAVPRTALPYVMKKVKEISEELDIPIVNFGHAGDGNIHVNIMIDDEDPEQVRGAKEALTRIFALTVEVGGTISGEHGVGLSKKPYIHMELSREQVELMKAIKRSFDPHNILNPHKIFPDGE